MKPAQTFSEEEDIRHLDTLSAILVILFTLFLITFYSIPFLQIVGNGVLLAMPTVTFETHISSY